MDRDGTTNTKMMMAKDEIDAFIMSLIGKKVIVVRYGERIIGKLKCYDGNRVIVDNVVYFLGPAIYLKEYK